MTQVNDWPPADAAQNYLDRIGYSGSRKPEYATLKALQKAHMTHVAFENLSISMGEPVVIDLAQLYDKIVVRKRGGFCYELNGLFGWLLGRLGFKVSMLSARVFMANGGLTPDFAHMLLAVGEGPDWIVDVGFGDCFIEPLPFTAGTWAQSGWFYRLREAGGSWELTRYRGDDPWENQYSFSPTARQFEDFNEMCAFQQTSPQSPFTGNTVCSRVADSGRITLSKMRLTIKGSSGSEQDLADASAYGAALRQYFDMSLDEASLEKLHGRIVQQMGGV